MIQVEKLSTTGPPVVRISVTEIEPGTPIRIERSVDGASWSGVRGVPNEMPVGDLFSANDWAFPLGRRVYYRLLSAGKLSGIAHVEVLDGSAWLQDAYRPNHGVQIRPGVRGANDMFFGKNSFRSANWSQHSYEVQVMGASTPVESIGVRSRVGEIPVEIFAFEDRDSEQLRNLLFQAGPLLVRGVGCNLLNNQFVVMPEVTETHRGNPHGITVFQGIARITREPSSEIRIGLWIYERAQEMVSQALPGATYEDVHARTTPETYSTVQHDPTLLIGAPPRLSIVIDAGS
jgi:hypothetical protein